jgi:MoaA/NifB/PqqE/SkfB family radical SAM enzyme
MKNILKRLFKYQIKSNKENNSMSDNLYGYLNTKIEELDRLHEEVVMRKWKGDRLREEITCLRPFENIEIFVDGSVHVCCGNWLKQGYEIGNIYDQNFDEIWNSEKAKKLRYSVCEGNFEYCTHFCDPFGRVKIDQKIDENFIDPPLISRKKANLKFNDYNECIVNTTPKTIALGCDPTCNLTCPSCRKNHKSLTREEAERLKKVLENTIKPMLRDCEELTLLTSGDVFASPVMSKFLKTITKKQYPKMKIVIYTNAQLLTPQKWAEFSNLEEFSITLRISIDAATKETYEKLRRGGSWDALCKNMAFIAGMRDKGIISHIDTCFIVQKENFLEIPKFVEKSKEWHSDNASFQAIEDWGIMNQNDFFEANVCSSRNNNYEKVINLLKEVREKHHEIKISTNIIK